MLCSETPLLHALFTHSARQLFPKLIGTGHPLPQASMSSRDRAALEDDHPGILPRAPLSAPPLAAVRSAPRTSQPFKTVFNIRSEHKVAKFCICQVL